MISLVGLPGSGKSTVGRQLARRLNVPFVDSDHEIEKRLGCSISEYFEREGEMSFRDVEQSTVADITAALGTGPLVTQYPLAISTDSSNNDSSLDMVLSTGGGAVLRQATRDCLRAAGCVVYLRSNPDAIFKRLRYDLNRPLLQVDDPLQKLRDLYETRDPLYRETAHFVIDTGRPSVAMLVNMIVMHLELARSSPLDSTKYPTQA